jgi:hypothetical protein
MKTERTKIMVAPASGGFNSASRRIVPTCAQKGFSVKLLRMLVEQAVSGVTPETTRGTRVLPTFFFAPSR